MMILVLLDGMSKARRVCKYHLHVRRDYSHMTVKALRTCKQHPLEQSPLNKPLAAL